MKIVADNGLEVVTWINRLPHSSHPVNAVENQWARICCRDLITGNGNNMLLRTELKTGSHWAFTEGTLIIDFGVL